MEVANTLAYYDTATITAVKSFIVQAPGLTIKYKTKLESPARGKHSRILETFVNYGCKMFYNIGPWIDLPAANDHVGSGQVLRHVGGQASDADELELGPVDGLRQLEEREVVAPQLSGFVSRMLDDGLDADQMFPVAAPAVVVYPYRHFKGAGCQEYKTFFLCQILCLVTFDLTT